MLNLSVSTTGISLYHPACPGTGVCMLTRARVRAHTHYHANTLYKPTPSFIHNPTHAQALVHEYTNVYTLSHAHSYTLNTHASIYKWSHTLLHAHNHALTDNNIHTLFMQPA